LAHPQSFLGTHGSPGGITSALIEYSPGFNVGRAKRIKEVVNVPVIGAGRFINLLHVADAWQILIGEAASKKHALVIGGGLIGMETADFLSQKGTQVTLVEVLKRSPVLKMTSHGYMLHTRLREAGCKLFFDTGVKRIEPSSVTLFRQGTEEVLSPVDQVVVAVGLKPLTRLKKFLEEKGIRHFVVGDAVLPRRIIEATEEGAKAAWSL
jgi:NADPH-dependent 2,4-dienoyl-CoA reductase/sulfur reductase-like enzyme